MDLPRILTVIMDSLSSPLWTPCSCFSIISSPGYLWSVHTVWGPLWTYSSCLSIISSPGYWQYLETVWVPLRSSDGIMLKNFHIKMPIIHFLFVEFIRRLLINLPLHKNQWAQRKTRLYINACWMVLEKSTSCKKSGFVLSSIFWKLLSKFLGILHQNRRKGIAISCSSNIGYKVT